MKKYQKRNHNNTPEYGAEIILKLDRIEAELETIKLPLLISNKQIVRLKEKMEGLEAKLQKLGQTPI